MKNIEIKFDQNTCPYSEALKEYTLAKVNKIIKKSKFNKIMIDMEIEHDDHIAKAVFHMPKKHIFVANAKSKDMYKSIDMLIPRIERIAKEYSEKLRDVKHNSLGNVYIDVDKIVGKGKK